MANDQHIRSISRKETNDEAQEVFELMLVIVWAALILGGIIGAGITYLIIAL